MGTEGESARRLRRRVRGRRTRTSRQRDRRPLGRRARQDRDAPSPPSETPDISMIGTTARASSPRRGASRPDAGRPGRRVVLLRGAWGPPSSAASSYARPLVRRDPRAVLPHGPGRAGRRPADAATWDGPERPPRRMQTAGAQWGINLQPGQTGAGSTSSRSHGRPGADIERGPHRVHLRHPRVGQGPSTYYQSFFSERVTPDGRSTRHARPRSSTARSARSTSGPWHVGLLRRARAARVHGHSTPSRRCLPASSRLVHRRLQPRRVQVTRRTATPPGSSCAG